jgi:hypothetical protein
MKRLFALVLGMSLVLPLVALTGCERDEEVMELETPEGEVEVERDADTGALEVEK